MTLINLQPIRRSVYLLGVLISGALTTTTLFATTLEIVVKDQKGNPLSDLVLTLDNLSQDPSIENKAQSEIYIDQVDKEFVPSVSVIRTGTSVNFPNKDNILHHVYSFSKAKRFDLPLYKGTPSKPIKFDQTGLVTLGCNIHDWMKAYVIVVDTPYHQVSDQQGKLTLTDLPAGTYSMELWHPRQRQKSIQELAIEEDLTLELTIPVKPSFRSRRHSSGSSNRYD